MPEERVDVSIEELGSEVRGAIARIFRRLRSEQTGEQLGDTQLFALTALVSVGPLTLRQLSERERVTPPSMNQTMNALVALGYVERRSDPTDRRKVLFAPTDRGSEVALASRERRHHWFDSHLETLDDAERSAMLETARILRTIADS